MESRTPASGNDGHGPTKLERFSERFLVGPLCATIITVLAAIVGLLGSVYSSEIGNAFPLHWGPYSSAVSGKATAFWVFLVSFGLLFFYRQKGTSDVRERAQEDLVRESRNLERLIRTLPPKDFLNSFAATWQQCATSAFESLREKKEIDRSVRIVLQGVVGLAKLFDGKPEGVRYAANIMLFYAIDDLKPSVLDDLRKRLQFCGDIVDLRVLRGVLDLQPELSWTTDGDTDSKLVPLALPIPKDIKAANGRWRILPGAPMALTCDWMDGYTDTSSLSIWCSEKGDFLPSTCDAVREYFETEAGRYIRSQVSLRLDAPVGDNPYGILNIHRNQAGLLEEKLPGTQFFALMRPFIRLIIELLRCRAEEKPVATGPQSH